MVATFNPPLASAQAPLPPRCQELVQDGGFEAGDQWLLDVTPWQAAIVAEGARSGSQAAFIGLRPEDANVESHSLIQQSIAFPADVGQITLRLWLRPLAAADDGDRNYVLFLSDQGELIAVPFFALATGDAWQEQTFDLTELAGQTLNMQIGVSNNGADPRAALLVDDVAIIACAAAQSVETPVTEPTTTATSTSQPTATPQPSPTPTATSEPPATLTPTPLPQGTAEAPATNTPATTRQPEAAVEAQQVVTPTSTPTPFVTFDIARPPRQLPLLDSQAAPILIGTLLSSVVILAVLAVNTRRPGR
jgi:hypothetical protein